MKIKIVICVVVGLYNLCSFAMYANFVMRHTDSEMRLKIVNCEESLKHVDHNNPLTGTRCPYDGEANEFKFDLIERGYQLNLYSDTIRKELRAKEFYPVIAVDPRSKNGHVVAHLCPFGCFALSTQILTFDQGNKYTHLSAKNIGFATKLAGLKSESFFDNPIMVPKNIEKIIKSKEQEEERLIAFELSNGNTLKVTVNHGMVLFDGRVVASQNVKENDSFIGYEGERVEIVSIFDFDQNAGVINFRLEGVRKGSDHIIGAEGVLVGDHAWQADMKDDLNGIAIRQASIQ